jgi:hypothetical protein
VLLKPVSLSTLHDALNETLAEIGGTVEARAPAATGREFRALQATRAGAQVLLAEDNVVNQEVATELSARRASRSTSPATAPRRSRRCASVPTTWC